MRPHRWTRIPTIAPLLVAAACGARPNAAPGGVAFDTLTVQDTIVTTDSELVGLVSDLALGADGRLYLADTRLKRILTVQPDGTDPHMVGREGAGPTACSWPS